jgi:hypothetical protein
LRKSNFVINHPLHCFACLVDGKLQSIDLTLRLELKEFGPRFFARFFTVSFVDYTCADQILGSSLASICLHCQWQICQQSTQHVAFGAQSVQITDFPGVFKVFFVENTLCHSNFVIQPSHRFACFINSNLPDQNSLRIKLPARSAGFDLTVAYPSSSALFRAIQRGLEFVQTNFCASALAFSCTSIVS